MYMYIYIYIYIYIIYTHIHKLERCWVSSSPSIRLCTGLRVLGGSVFKDSIAKFSWGCSVKGNNTVHLEIMHPAKMVLLAIGVVAKSWL